MEEKYLFCNVRAITKGGFVVESSLVTLPGEKEKLFVKAKGHYETHHGFNFKIGNNDEIETKTLEDFLSQFTFQKISKETVDILNGLCALNVSFGLDYFYFVF